MAREIEIPIKEIINEGDVRERVKRSGVRKKTIEENTESGVFQRVSYLLCSMHCLMSVAYRLFGEVDLWFDEAGIKRHEIQKECNRFHEFFDRWYSFWRGYQDATGTKELNSDSEDLYRQFMDWANLPLYWNPGDSQRTKRDVEPMIVIDDNDKYINIYKDVANRELLSDIEEEWGVFLAEYRDNKRYMRCVESGMDKASSMMSAKRLSANDEGQVYIAACMQDVRERRLEIIPYKAFMNGQTAGSVKNVIKK